MNGKFKTCARGHYYSAELDHCPYCPSSSNGVGNAAGPVNDDNNRTMDVSSLNPNQPQGSVAEQYRPTADMGQGGAGDETKTSFVGDLNKGSETKTNGNPEAPAMPVFSNRTMMFEDDDPNQPQAALRERRKLVGWLVSYTLDDMGMDFKLYEGRNIIGRDMDCQITIADKTVSGKHAVILFRAGKFSITDQQSTQGTFVNNEDIELEPRYIKDGDMIRVGQTVLKFRTSI